MKKPADVWLLDTFSIVRHEDVAIVSKPGSSSIIVCLLADLADAFKRIHVHEVASFDEANALMMRAFQCQCLVLDAHNMWSTLNKFTLAVSALIANATGSQAERRYIVMDRFRPNTYLVLNGARVSSRAAHVVRIFDMLQFETAEQGQEAAYQFDTSEEALAAGAQFPGAVCQEIIALSHSVEEKNLDEKLN